jgi:hypothetical protein
VRTYNSGCVRKERQSARKLPERDPEETAALVPKESIEVNAYPDFGARRVLQPIVISIFALSVGGVLAFFQKSDLKEPLVLVVPSVAGAALAVWAAVEVYRSRRFAGEVVPRDGTKGAVSVARMHEGAHEIESTVLLRALEVFGDSERALKWMREANPALNSDTPLHAIQTDEGRRQVLNILGRIEYGVIS